MGRAVLEDRVNDEVGILICQLAHAQGETFNIYYTLRRAIANVISSLMFGARFEYDDPVLQKYLDFIQIIFEQAGAVGLLSFFPFLKYLPGDPFKDKYLKDVNAKFRAEIRETLVVYRESKIKGHGNSNSMIDFYLDAIEKNKDVPGTSFDGKQVSLLIIMIKSNTVLKWLLDMFLYSSFSHQKEIIMLSTYFTIMFTASLKVVDPIFQTKTWLLWTRASVIPH